MVVIDIDRFKAVNDNWGHAAGDELLVTFAGGPATGAQALTAADAALYSAKSMGRDQVAMDTTPTLPVGVADEANNQTTR